MTGKQKETMKGEKTLTKLREWLVIQISSYESLPPKDDLDKGWKRGLESCLKMLDIFAKGKVKP